MIGMCFPVSRRGQVVALACGIGLAAAALLAGMSRTACALTPDSPVVKEAVERGIRYLASPNAQDPRLGATALAGIALLKHRIDPKHPKIIEAVAAIEKTLGDRNPAKIRAEDSTIYSIGLSIIFLVELDHEKYRADIECMLAYLRLRQKEKKDGAWGYQKGHGHESTCDTSMTQYGVLSFWVAKEKGFNIPTECIESVAYWLVCTQDPEGGFGYQGHVGSIGALVQQSEVRPSMTAAGSGSLYICADMLDLIKQVDERDKPPSALKEVKSKDFKEKKLRVDLRQIRETQDRAGRWLEKHDKVTSDMPWLHYYLYALERCMAFRYLFEHREEEEPRWYTDGAEFLLKTQGQEGWWSGQCGQVPDTAFSVLFLKRSTGIIVKQALKYRDSTMVGGKGGIPKDLRMLDFRGGQAVSRAQMGTADKLLAALGKDMDKRDFDKLPELLADLPSDEIETLKDKYGDKIRQLVGAQSPEARLAVVKALGKTRDLDNVDTLIYALTDPDHRVVRAANDGLLHIRRASAAVVAAMTLPDTFTDDDRRSLIERWKTWFHSIRPDPNEP
jgi:hypothetical protein